jgi:D-amino peptidase
MVQELDASFDAALFVGYHSLAGWAGNPLAHTLSSSKIAAMRLNGRPASEYLLHAYGAELHEVPVVFVSGDEELCAHVAERSPACRTVATLRGVGASVVSQHPDAATAAIQETVQEALSGELAASRLPRLASYRLELDYKRPTDAYAKAFYPGAERVGPATLAVESDDYFELLRALRFVV